MIKNCKERNSIVVLLPFFYLLQNHQNCIQEKENCTKIHSVFFLLRMSQFCEGFILDSSELENLKRSPAEAGGKLFYTIL